MGTSDTKEALEENKEESMRNRAVGVGRRLVWRCVWQEAQPRSHATASAGCRLLPSAPGLMDGGTALGAGRPRGGEGELEAASGAAAFCHKWKQDGEDRVAPACAESVVWFVCLYCCEGAKPDRRWDCEAVLQQRESWVLLGCQWCAVFLSKLFPEDAALLLCGHVLRQFWFHRMFVSWRWVSFILCLVSRVKMLLLLLETVEKKTSFEFRRSSESPYIKPRMPGARVSSRVRPRRWNLCRSMCVCACARPSEGASTAACVWNLMLHPDVTPNQSESKTAKRVS